MEIEKNILNMLSIATHEIRGPLASIGMTLKLVCRGSYGKIDESVKVTLEELRQRILRLENVVNDYLGKASFLDLKDGVPKKEKLDLREDIIDPLLEDLLPEIQENEIIIDNKLGGIPGHKIIIDAHKAWLRMVFRVLIRNGIKHGGKGCTIAIGYEDRGDWFAFIVFNNGPSIPYKNREKIFEKFYSSEEKGTGLGLYIARKLVRNHGGEIWCEDALDGHPKFVFTLPK